MVESIIAEKKRLVKVITSVTRDDSKKGEI